jgi:hypothetical protein
MNSSESEGQAGERRNKTLIPLAMMFIVIGMMFVVLFGVSSGSHGGAVHGMGGNSGLGHWLLIVLGIGFEIVGLVLAVSAAVATKKS